MKLSTNNVNLGWQSAINGQTFGPAMQKTTDLWAWQQAVLQPQTLSREQIAALGAVLEFAISKAGNGKNPEVFNLACELFHNLNLGE
jgi:hypothetical protein